MTDIDVQLSDEEVIDVSFGDTVYTDADALDTINSSDINPVSITSDDITVPPTPPSASSNEQVSVLNIGNDQSATTSDGAILNTVDVELRSSEQLRGLRSNITATGDGNATFGMFSRVTLDSAVSGNPHNQGICFYGRIIQNDGSDGSTPPSAGVYLDSRNSNVRPFAAFVDDAESIWTEGIVLNGDYSEQIIRTGVWNLSPIGNIDREGTVVTNTSGPKTSSYTITEDDEVVFVDSSSGGFSVTLVDAYCYSGMRKTIKDNTGSAGTSSITIRTNGSALIDGADQYNLDTAYESVTVVGDGTNWNTI